MSQLIRVELVNLWESEGSKVLQSHDDDAFTGNLQVKSKGSYSEALSGPKCCNKDSVVRERKPGLRGFTCCCSFMRNHFK